MERKEQIEFMQRAAERDESPLKRWLNKPEVKAILSRPPDQTRLRSSAE